VARIEDRPDGDYRGTSSDGRSAGVNFLLALKACTPSSAEVVPNGPRPINNGDDRIGGSVQRVTSRRYRNRSAS